VAFLLRDGPEMFIRKDQSAAWQRFEAKYLIDEVTAAHVRRHCRMYLPLDKYCARRPEGCYPITSIYLDSPDLRLYRSTIEREVYRFKLRIRTYSPAGEWDKPVPAFFEVKHRAEGIVKKTRARISPQLAESLLWDVRTIPHDGCGHDPFTIENLGRFQSMRARLGVQYDREVYEAPERDSVRISFDRNLQYGLLDPDRLSRRVMWSPAPLGSVILEIKFTNTYPFWVRDLVRQEGLQRRGFCKFVHCVRKAGIETAVPVAGMHWS
jgi:hypothetical protein